MTVSNSCEPNFLMDVSSIPQMRLLVVCFLALSGWAAAAPGTTAKSNDLSEEVQQKQEPENDTLAPALSDIARRKRGSSPTNLPYSNYRPSSGMHRYRYPLYRKRSYRPQPSYDYEDEVLLPEVESEYQDYDEQMRGPSLFRERSFQQQQDRKKEMLPEDEGYFSDDYVPDSQLLANPYVVPLAKKRDSLYTLGNSPYDLNTMGRMYEVGKRDEVSNLYDYDDMNQIHSVGRKSSPRMTPTDQFYDAINAIRKKKAMFDGAVGPAESTAEAMERLKLKNALRSAATHRYFHSQADPMIRRKRETMAKSPNMVVKVNATAAHNNDLASTIPDRYQQAQLFGDRRKRAFNDYYKWEKNALADELDPYEKRTTATDRDYNDYLTREYFKSIARSVGQMNKRMTTTAKRSPGIDEMLENPTVLAYVTDKLKEEEEEVSQEAERELKAGETEDLLDNTIVRLDALERMREALNNIFLLQQGQEPPRGAAVSDLRSASAKKRSGSTRKKLSAVDGRRIRRMRRGEDILNTVFLDNKREDCPVLDRILSEL
ncbi:hypothetical protein SK128_012553 [Halocaridina rubra]|uniref:Uncharacterized protein n=1 Tax=Halocaridina rubra TaxID=373956 RepID=A0AAN8XII9_HALRR